MEPLRAEVEGSAQPEVAGRNLAQAAMGPELVVIVPPLLEGEAGIVEIDEPVLRKALPPQRGVEALDVGVVRRLPRPAEVQLNLVPVGPVVQGPGGEFGAIVHGDQDRKSAARTTGLRQDHRHVLPLEAPPGHLSDALPGEGVDRREDPNRAAAGQQVVHEVHSPPLIGRSGFGPDLAHRSALPPLRPFALEGEPLLGVEAVDPLVMDVPAFPPQEDREPRIAPAHPARRELAQPPAERLLGRLH